jgi:hypothetical protein
MTTKSKPILSKWDFYDEDTGKFYIGDPADASEVRWNFPNESGNVLMAASEADVDGDIAASVDHSSGIVLHNNVYNDYGTLITGQEYKAGYFRYNVRSTTPGNPVAEVTGLEGVAASYIADEALTFRGGYFRTYINADVTSTMRTAIGAEVSARASYSGGTECVAEAGTAFIGMRIWMAPFFSDASISNINNHHALWILNEAAGKFVTNAIKIDATTYNSGFTYAFNADSGKFRLALDGSEAGSGLVAGETVTTSGDDWFYLQADDYRTLTSSQVYRALYARYNVRSTAPSNPTAEVTGIEGVAAAYVSDEALTYRGGHFRTYINADATSTMRTNIGLEASARGSYAGGTACVAEVGTAFVGERIWMAPYFTAGSVGNINNFWGLWIYGEHSSQRNADAAIYISDAGGGFTDIIRLTAAGGADADVNLVKLLVTGNPTIIWDESEDKWGFNKGLVFSAPGAMKMGSYASPLDLGSSTVFGFGQMWGSGSGSDTFIIGQQYFVKTTESARPFPLCVQAEIDNDGSTYPDRGQAAQFIILLGGGGEASKLGALGGDATAGMYASWHKVGANVSCSTIAGCRVAPLWIDNQMYCVVNGEEYAAFITTGGSVPDAVFGFESTSSGWNAFLLFDETCADLPPVITSGCNVSGAGASEPYLRVMRDGTEYGIPLIAI